MAWGGPFLASDSMCLGSAGHASAPTDPSNGNRPETALPGEAGRAPRGSGWARPAPPTALLALGQGGRAAEGRAAGGLGGLPSSTGRHRLGPHWEPAPGTSRTLVCGVPGRVHYHAISTQRPGRGRASYAAPAAGPGPGSGLPRPLHRGQRSKAPLRWPPARWDVFDWRLHETESSARPPPAPSPTLPALPGLASTAGHTRLP